MPPPFQVWFLSEKQKRLGMVTPGWCCCLRANFCRHVATSPSLTSADTIFTVETALINRMPACSRRTKTCCPLSFTQRPSVPECAQNVLRKRTFERHAMQRETLCSKKMCVQCKENKANARASSFVRTAYIIVQLAQKCQTIQQKGRRLGMNATARGAPVASGDIRKTKRQNVATIKRLSGCLFVCSST